MSKSLLRNILPAYQKKLKCTFITQIDLSILQQHTHLKLFINLFAMSKAY